MFKRLKKEMSTNQYDSLGNEGASAGLDLDLAALDKSHALNTSPSPDWIAAHEAFFKTSKSGAAFSLSGQVEGKPWKFEKATTPRTYVSGEELRARADIDVEPTVSVLVMNRVLKEALEKRAYELYTDSLETHASPALMEEMRWLALYPETGWEGLPHGFWQRFAVMSSRRADAVKWLTPELAAMLMTWPEPSPSAEVPFILMLMRGKTHLRMQWGRADEHLMAHAGRLLIAASLGAMASFPRQAPGLLKK